MEIDETQLRNLSMKAWSLVDNISDEIENEDISVCRHCSEHRLLCGIAESPRLKEEKQRLMAIQDSLKEVDNMLVLLQRLQSHQRHQCREASIKLEKSRVHLMANIKHFQEHEDGGQVDVIDELNQCFSTKNLEKQSDQLKVEDRSSWGFINCIRGFLNPWNWHTTAKTAINLALISVSISSTYKFCQSGQENKCASPESVIARKFDSLAIDEDSPLDVLYGMG